MKDLYDKNEYCMSFSNAEIEEYFLIPLKKKSKIHVTPMESQGNFVSIAFDGDIGNFFISFYGHQTSIFTCSEEFMFIDDNEKENTVSSDTYGNVVYEGVLRDKTKREILELLFEFITILNRAKEITIEEIVISQDGFQYPKCRYNIELSGDNDIKGSIEFENILFAVNN